ncbi:alpha-1,4-glucan--maltose-1-phosphate maltosyltransferase [Chryseolinea lacunae]|uniref:Alpha-1,4-glucan:maltose-1-phosphate maltosyltransferase n=1 Tax=Chryseolinea lacunae TaxID=2801331 RepID=A0ABS1KW40_9BACT|nr:alpha-1,4-glucan--maltose-1-phosphate maltosyltransferase [Chryseolinea lacunae]MBL0743655.1 alpha-1,4-glucan--maltose-1-phosphate maltosyltransferase [Chryseolinea lacunae]
MIITKGKSRVVIENVQPQVDGGLYPAKRTIGERVTVTADIFGDGHDHIRAHMLYRKEGAKQWNHQEMTPSYNDTWFASFTVTEKGAYEFTVMAWVDHFDTWYDGFKKKATAKVDVHVELQEGVNHLKALGGDKNDTLKAAIGQLQGDYTAAIHFVQGEAFGRLVHEHPLIQHETTYDKTLRVVVEHVKANFSAWYELFPRSASLDGKHGTFKDVIKLLPRVSAMGFDVLYLPPIHPIGKVNRKGKNNNVRAELGEPGSPWAIGNDEGGHKAVHAELGTLVDYKKLIEEAKKLNIDIALDLAFQCAPDHPYVKEHPEWFKQRPDGSIQYAENPPKKYQDIYPFNFETDQWMELWVELKSVITFWIEQGVKIFRVDNPHTKPIPFWEWAIAEVNKEYEDIIFLAEAFTKPKVMASLGKIGYTQSYTYFTWRVYKSEIIEYMNELVHGPSRNYFRPNFWPNTPDILPFHLQQQGENIFILRLALAATLSSNYGVYGPVYEFYENVPVQGREEYHDSEKYEVKHHDWKKTSRATDIMYMINKARKENAALQSTWNLNFCTIENVNLLAYIKATDDLSSIILTVVNLDPNGRHSGYVQLPKSLLKLGDRINVKVHDLITDEHYTWTQEWNYVELDPYKLPFHLFKVEVHESYL